MVRYDLAGILEAHLDRVRRTRDAADATVGLLSDALKGPDAMLDAYISKLSAVCAHDNAVSVAHAYYWEQMR